MLLFNWYEWSDHGLDVGCGEGALHCPEYEQQIFQSERMILKRSPRPDLPFVLAAQVADIYFHCFGRMYTVTSPQERRSLDVKNGLQTEFEELVDSTSLYLSSRFWSKEDELRIREYFYSPRCPHSQYRQDLVCMTGVGRHGQHDSCL